MNTLNISIIVSDLLQFNECVTIPDFGAFVVNPSSAQIDMAKNRLIPPGKKVTFNKSITTNDGLLANALSISQGISHEEANQYLKSFVNEISAELKSKNVFEFHQIGTFYKGHGNIIKFESTSSNSLTSFGLEQLNLTPLSAQPGMGKDAIVPHPGTLRTEIQYIERTSTLGKIGWGLAAIPVLAYLVWMPTNSGLLNNNRDFQFSNLNPFKPAPCEEYVPRPVGLTTIDLSATNLLHENFNELDYKFSVTKTTKAVTETPKVKVKSRYQIIGGCFSKKSNAARLVSNLQEQGYSASIFDKKGKLYRVSVGGFTNQREARKELKRIKANTTVSAWLYKVK